MDTQTQLLLGITRTRAYDLLDEAFDGGLHPLDLFEFEMQLKSADSDFCSLTSEQARVEQAYLNATELQKVLAPTLTRPVGAWQRIVCLHVDQHHETHHIPIVFDTAVPLSP